MGVVIYGYKVPLEFISSGSSTFKNHSFTSVRDVFTLSLRSEAHGGFVYRIQIFTNQVSGLSSTTFGNKTHAIAHLAMGEADMRLRSIYLALVIS